MRTIYYRGLFLAMSLLPAAIMLLLTSDARSSLLGAVGATGVIGVASLIAIIAIRFSIPAGDARLATQRSTEKPRLLTKRAGNALAGDLPPTKHMRARVDWLLAHQPLTKAYGAFGGEPDSVDRAISRVVRLIANTWKKPTSLHMAPEQLTDIYVMDQLLRAKPEDAGRLAQLFRDPSRMLEIRDQIAALGQQNERFNRHKNAYSAMWSMWSNRQNCDHRLSQVDTLAAMSHPDPDLWHQIIAEHDPDQPDQRNAALWCALQPECDRASVALFLALSATQSTLVYAAETGDRVFLDGVHQIIQQWNNAVYHRHEFALDPPELVMRAAGEFDLALTELSQILDIPVWPMPKSAFTEYSGISPKPRPCWDMHNGGLVRKPMVPDYRP